MVTVGAGTATGAAAGCTDVDALFSAAARSAACCSNSLVVTEITSGGLSDVLGRFRGVADSAWRYLAPGTLLKTLKRN